MQSFCVVQHTYSEFLGLIEKQLERRDIGFSYFRPFLERALPGAALQYDALFLLGGAWPITDREHCPWVDEERELMRSFQEARRPVVGIGFGALLVAALAGAAVSDEPAQRAYWTTARATEAGRGDPLAQAVDGRRVLVMCNGSARLPHGLPPLVVDEAGDWIAVRPDPLTYGIVFRPEVNPGMLEDILMEANRPSPDNLGELIATAREEWVETQRTTDQVIVALVTALSLMQERHKPPVFVLKVES